MSFNLAKSVSFKKRITSKSIKPNENRSSVQFNDNRNESDQIQNVQMMAKKYSSGEEIIQKKENQTGLPDNLKSGIENLSGYSMDDVKVNYNSSKPAQLNAHAFAQGTDIHIATGQEKHLPHEAWHVVQQKQGRVQPIKQLKDKVNINDDAGLEKEADVMGKSALNFKKEEGNTFRLTTNLIESKPDSSLNIHQAKRIIIDNNVGVNIQGIENQLEVEINSKDITISDFDLVSIEKDEINITLVDENDNLRHIIVSRKEIDKLKEYKNNEPELTNENVLSKKRLSSLKQRNIEDGGNENDKVLWTQMVGNPYGKNLSPKPRHVKQGVIGTCFLISGLEAIVRFYPGLIMRAISIKNINGNLIYQVIMKDPKSQYKSKKQLNVSAWLPTMGGKFIFALGGWRTPTVENPVAWWPGLLEKAYAELRGGFANIAGGDKRIDGYADPLKNQGFLRAMGMKVSNFRGKRDTMELRESSIKRIIDAYENKQVVLLEGPGHSYSLVRANVKGAIISDPNSDKRHANYNEDEPIEIKKWDDIVGTPESTIFMEWDDFRKNFQSVTIGIL